MLTLRAVAAEDEKRMALTRSEREQSVHGNSLKRQIQRGGGGERLDLRGRSQVELHHCSPPPHCLLLHPDPFISTCLTPTLAFAAAELPPQQKT